LLDDFDDGDEFELDDGEDGAAPGPATEERPSKPAR
jgi:hypothetical protein